MKETANIRRLDFHVFIIQKVSLVLCFPMLLLRHVFLVHGDLKWVMEAY